MIRGRGQCKRRRHVEWDRRERSTRGKEVRGRQPGYKLFSERSSRSQQTKRRDLCPFWAAARGYPDNVRRVCATRGRRVRLLLLSSVRGTMGVDRSFRVTLPTYRPHSMDLEMALLHTNGSSAGEREVLLCAFQGVRGRQLLRAPWPKVAPNSHLKGWLPR